ncbi:MAG: tRNA (cytidine(34)-2'-O)-methyltransferase [Hyphomicrobiales bacterium]|nr:tRNA (cytidine(34)-2'-O)-methyltransferase [Hyphomicrobiales bacterium]
MPDLVLFQPDIPGNTGTLMRLAACLDFNIHIIQPAGFRLDDVNLKRAGMDYLELTKLIRHADWKSFEDWRIEQQRRLLLLTTKGDKTHLVIKYRKSDLIMLGRESSGVPEFVHQIADHSIVIPMHRKARSINIALSGALVMGEALRQTDKYPN